MDTVFCAKQRGLVVLEGDMMVWVWDALKMLIAGIRQEGMTALLILLFVAAGIWILEALKKSLWRQSGVHGCAGVAGDRRPAVLLLGRVYRG